MSIWTSSTITSLKKINSKLICSTKKSFLCFWFLIGSGSTCQIWLKKNFSFGPARSKETLEKDLEEEAFRKIKKDFHTTTDCGRTDLSCTRKTTWQERSFPTPSIKQNPINEQEHLAVIWSIKKSIERAYLEDHKFIPWTYSNDPNSLVMPKYLKNLNAS